ncbi:MAG: DUF4956 domain-containing protein [Clostridia bacterium]|nr:DUF4956 domain-containing protein [Clostridia bacterium]
MIEVFESIINSYSNESITTVAIVAVLLMVTILSIYEFFVYRFVSHRSFYNKSFNITIAILPFFIATIIMCLQSNIIITLGTIGALAIIRFRTAVKDPVDMLYLLWSVFIGIICGCQLFEAGVLTSVVVTIVLIILEHINFGRKSFVLIVRSNEDVENDLANLFKSKKISHRFKSRNYSSKGFDYAIELTYKNIKELNEELSKNERISKYSIIEYDADDIV